MWFTGLLAWDNKVRLIKKFAMVIKKQLTGELDKKVLSLAKRKKCKRTRNTLTYVK